MRCLFFARYAELIGTDATDLAFEGDATVADAVRTLRATVPNGSTLPERPLVAVNRVHALYDRQLADGDEVALLPPLAGG